MKKEGTIGEERSNDLQGTNDDERSTDGKQAKREVQIQNRGENHDAREIHPVRGNQLRREIHFHGENHDAREIHLDRGNRAWRVNLKSE